MYERVYCAALRIGGLSQISYVVHHVGFAQDSLALLDPVIPKHPDKTLTNVFIRTAFYPPRFPLSHVFRFSVLLFVPAVAFMCPFRYPLKLGHARQ